jgi:hypothetical protein
MMIDIEAITAKIRRLPESLIQEVEDFVDFLQARQSALPPNTASGSHPAMVAFGLWKDEPDLVDLTDRIYANRLTQSSRPKVSL